MGVSVSLVLPLLRLEYPYERKKCVYACVHAHVPLYPNTDSVRAYIPIRISKQNPPRPQAQAHWNSGTLHLILLFAVCPRPCPAPLAPLLPLSPSVLAPLPPTSAPTHTYIHLYMLTQILVMSMHRIHPCMHPCVDAYLAPTYLST